MGRFLTEEECVQGLGDLIEDRHCLDCEDYYIDVLRKAIILIRRGEVWYKQVKKMNERIKKMEEIINGKDY